MHDEPLKTGGPYLTEIDINHDCELRYWAWKFRVRPEMVIEAVKAVGPRADDVEKHLMRA